VVLKKLRNGSRGFVSVNQQRLFFQQFKADFFHTGAVLPSSAALARAVVAYLAQKEGQVQVLEAGPGTGAFTRHIVPLLQPGDSLDIVEINPTLITYLQQYLRSASPEITIRLLNGDVSRLPLAQTYDYIIFSLPLTNFPSHMVQEILTLMLERLKPGGMFSYVKYIFIGNFKYLFGGAEVRAAMKGNQEIIDRFTCQYQLERRAVLANLPPTWVYYWQKPFS
jgi:phospholipid N-methyltransferase